MTLIPKPGIVVRKQAFTSSNKWNSANDWVPARIPKATDDVIIPHHRLPILIDQNAVVRNLTFLADYDLPERNYYSGYPARSFFRLDDGVTLTINGNYQVGDTVYMEGTNSLIRLRGNLIGLDNSHFGFDPGTTFELMGGGPQFISGIWQFHNLKAVTPGTKLLFNPDYQTYVINSMQLNSVMMDSSKTGLFKFAFNGNVSNVNNQNIQIKNSIGSSPSRVLIPAGPGSYSLGNNTGWQFT